MPESNSEIGYGDTLEWSTDGGTTWAGEVAELKACDLPTNTVGKVERTHMKSPNRTKEFATGLRDPQDVGFTFNFNSADYEALFTLESLGTAVTWRHTIAPTENESAGAVYTYRGSVELGGGSREVEGVAEISATIRRLGAHTFTPAVPA